jgi:hypothetical protein
MDNYIQSELNLGDNIVSGKPRNLINGKKAKSYLKPIDLVIHTKAPEKWKLVDMETGQEYMGLAKPGDLGMWDKIEEQDPGIHGFMGYWSDPDLWSQAAYSIEEDN